MSGVTLMEAPPAQDDVVTKHQVGLHIVAGQDPLNAVWEVLLNLLESCITAGEVVGIDQVNLEHCQIIPTNLYQLPDSMHYGL